MCNCGRNKTTMSSPPILPASGLSMSEFVTQNGWNKIGQVGCCDNVRDRYINGTYPNREIWINERIKRMEFVRKFVTDRDGKSERTAGPINFEHVYKAIHE